MYGLNNIVKTLKNTLLHNSNSGSLGRVALNSQQNGNAFDVVLVPLSEVKTDEKNFQNRGDKYSAKSVQSIIDAVGNGNFNWFAFDPVILWENSDGEKFVLSGHSRTQAFREINENHPDWQVDGIYFDAIPARIYKGSFENAKQLALNSNTLATPETITERAAYFRNLREKNSITGGKELQALRKKALKENNGQMIWDISFLPGDGISFNALKSFKLGEQDGSPENFLRLATICQWIGKAFQIYQGLSSAHDRELFNFLMNGGYGSKSGQYFNFTSLNDRLQKLYENNVADERKVNARGEYTEPFQIAAYKKNDAEIEELTQLKKESDDAFKELKKKFKELRDNSATREQIYEIATPYFNGWANALYKYWQLLDRVPKKDNTPSLFGVDDISFMPEFYEQINEIFSNRGLGKPTIKLEFETNSELADFLKGKKTASQYAASDITDSYTFENGFIVPKKKKSKKDNKAITANNISQLPPSDGSKQLPPSNGPKQLPPSNTANLPKLQSVLKPDGVFLDKRKIGDYGYINDRLKYVDLFINREYAVSNNMFDFAEKIFPGAVIIVCYERDGKWKFAIEKKYNKILSNYLPQSYFAYYSSAKRYFIDDIPLIEKIIKGFEKEGYPVVLIHRNIVDDINDIPQPSSPAALPPHVEPTTAQATTPAQKSSEPDWATISNRFANASGWSSMDPERSARVHTQGFKELYNKYVALVDPSKIDAFNNFFNNYVNEIIAARSRTASWAVTGGGGITASKARKLNAASDRFMQISANFEAYLSDYVNKLNRSARRADFVAKSLDERAQDRFNELKKVVDYIVASANLLQNFKKDRNLILQHPKYSFYLRMYGRPELAESATVRMQQYNINLDKAGLYDKIFREYKNGNNLVVNKILDYLKENKIFTDKHKIWQLYKAIEEKPDFATIDESPKIYEGAEIVENRELDRLQIKFDGIPSEDCRNELKKSGFRWAPYYKVWQRKLTPAAIRDANNIVAKYYNTISLGKPTIKFEFEDNNELMNLFEPGVSGLTVNDKPAAIFNCSESELQTQGYYPTYKRLADYSSLIDFADGAKTLKGYGFDNATLDELLNACTKYKQVEKLAAHLKDADKLQSAFNVWHWLHTNINYNYDTPGQEEIRTPARVWRDRYSGVDCDCLAVFSACLFLNMGYKPYFEIVAFNNSPTYSHIYVNLDGYAIDRVLPVFLARPSGITKTKFMAIPVYELSGIGKCSTLQGVYDSTLYKMQQGNATTDEINDFRKTQILLTLKGIDEDLYKVAALLMPHVVTISDDGKYYFDTKKAAEVARKADAQLAIMKQQNLSDIQKKYLMREIIDELDGITATSNDNDTIVIIINPKGVSTPIMANMVESTLPHLEVKPDATDNAENTVLQVYQTTAAPAQYLTYKEQ